MRDRSGRERERETESETWWAVHRYCGVATPCDSAGIMASTAASLLTTPILRSPSSPFDNRGVEIRLSSSFRFSIYLAIYLCPFHHVPVAVELLSYVIIVINNSKATPSNAEDKNALAFPYHAFARIAWNILHSSAISYM